MFFRKHTLSATAYVLALGKMARLLLALFLFVLVPYSLWWVYTSGDVAVERAVALQASGRFALFGSGISQDFVDYKLQLYEKVRPTVVALGSSRVMQFRESCFRKPFLNMGGVAGNLPVLRSTVDAMLEIHRPEAIILGVDFWWFLPAWNPNPFQEEPPTHGSYTYGFANLKKPWTWLLQGKIGVHDLAAPLLGLLGAGFRADRFGIMAQQTDDGFASDGSWYYTAETTGQKPPFDFQFRDTMTQIVYGTKAFAHASPDDTLGRHLDAFAEIYCRLQSRGIHTYVFLPPVAESIYEALKDRAKSYPHLFSLADALKARGIPVLDCSNPKSLGSSDCEFVDGFHAGEIATLRVLRALCDQWSSVLSFVNIDAVHKRISEWKGHVYAHDPRVTDLWECDFNDFGCKKRQR